MVPVLGSKYPEPTTGANAGVYNNIRKEDNSLVPQEVSRSGVGIVAESQIGDSVDITYTGNIVLPSQEIPIPGKPGYTYAGATHRTETVGIDEDMIHGHAHFGTFARGRIMTTQADGSNPAETNNTPRAEGPTGRQTASTINIEDWLDNTLYDGATKVFEQVDKKMTKFISEKLKVSSEEAKKIQFSFLDRPPTLTELVLFLSLIHI